MFNMGIMIEPGTALDQPGTFVEAAMLYQSLNIETENKIKEASFK